MREMVYWMILDCEEVQMEFFIRSRRFLFEIHELLEETAFFSANVHLGGLGVTRWYI